MRVFLFHPSTAPHVQQVGRALFEAQMLGRFATTLVDRPDDPWQQASCGLAKRLGFDLKSQLQRRAITEFPLESVVNSPWGELTRLLSARIDPTQRLTDRVWEWSETGFDRWVSRQVTPAYTAVYGYEHASLATFKAAKARGVACIYDVPAPEHEFVQTLLQQELETNPEANTPYYDYIKQHQQRRTQRRRQEWELADIVMANSNFTKASYAAAGLDTEKVRVLPLGAPPVVPAGVAGGTSVSEPCRCLWAGSFSIRKGAHYFLQAWQQLQPGDQATLEIFGAMGLPASLVQDLPDSVQISGTVPRSQLFEIYQQADVLVFPTLCDGFGMVVTEAFAHGLPVITTTQAGASDLVRHGENGLVVPARDVEALTEALAWCITHRQDLKVMRKAALETAAHWQWSDYRRILTETLATGLKSWSQS